MSPVIDRDGLMTAGDIDDAEPRRAEPCRAQHRTATIVGTAMVQRRDHRREHVSRRVGAGQREEAGNAAHEGTFSFREGPARRASSSRTKPATRSADRPSRN